MKGLFKSILLGLGLAMDASAVSASDGIANNKVKLNKIVFIAFVFSFFQGVMPLLGYFIGNATIARFSYMIPWISLILLVFLGLIMLIEGLKKNKEIEEENELTVKIILIQALATSIDAFSVGFTMSTYSLVQAIISVSIISIVTFICCILSAYFGKKIGNKLGDYAKIIGGCILIFIGIEIFVSGMFF